MKRDEEKTNKALAAYKDKIRNYLSSEKKKARERAGEYALRYIEASNEKSKQDALLQTKYHLGEAWGYQLLLSGLPIPDSIEN